MHCTGVVTHPLENFPLKIQTCSCKKKPVETTMTNNYPENYVDRSKTVRYGNFFLSATVPLEPLPGLIHLFISTVELFSLPLLALELSLYSPINVSKIRKQTSEGGKTGVGAEISVHQIEITERLTATSHTSRKLVS